MGSFSRAWSHTPALGLLGMGLRRGTAVPAALQPAGCPKGALGPTAQSFSVFCLFFLLPLGLCLPELSPINCGAFKQRRFLLSPLLPSGMCWLKQQLLLMGKQPNWQVCLDAEYGLFCDWKTPLNWESASLVLNYVYKEICYYLSPNSV